MDYLTHKYSFTNRIEPRIEAELIIIISPVYFENSFGILIDFLYFSPNFGHGCLQNNFQDKTLVTERHVINFEKVGYKP